MHLLFVFPAQMCPQSTSTDGALHEGAGCGWGDVTVDNAPAVAQVHGHVHTHTPGHTQCKLCLLWGPSFSNAHSLSYPSEHETPLRLFPELVTRYHLASFDHKVAKFYNIQKIQ